MKSKSPRQAGVALIIVLGFLVIITALAVAFFSSVTTELKATRNFASGVSTRQLSESAVNVIMGQIRDATSRSGMAWASQPGMIRIYDTNAANSFFKLYSSDNMIVTGADIPTFDPSNDFATDWNTYPSLYTDLNSPVFITDPAGISQTVPRFPIIDPRAYKTPSTDPYFDYTNDPANPYNVNIEGFWYGKDPNKATATVPNLLTLPVANGNPNLQRLPMPTRWIYVLQDGTLTTPNPSNGSNPSTSTIAKWNQTIASTIPTKSNPIVGRIAFWTDDDTCKVNINTAGGYVEPSTADFSSVPELVGYDINTYPGSFWDTPRTDTVFDKGNPYPDTAGITLAGTPKPGGGGLAICQLLQNEFQRYPGHPATTSLGLIFKNVLTSEQLYKILPRFGTTNATNQAPGSSLGGTARVIPTKAAILADPANANPKADDLQIQPKVDRLYSSVDEMLLAAQLKNPINDSYQRKTNDALLGVGNKVTPDLLDRLRFFLTAQSRAPELNLSGQPRVTVWPVRSETNSESGAITTTGLNPFDKVMLFCSSIGPTSTAAGAKTSDPASSTVPYRYIFTRRELPAATATGITNEPTWSTPPTQDIDLLRNADLINYLKGLTSKTIPGFGGNFLSKLGLDNRNMLLVEMFDYIRGANLNDTTTFSYTATGTPATRNTKSFSPRGIVMPTKTTLGGTPKLSGLGRFPTISEATLVFYYAGPRMAGVDPVSKPGDVANTAPGTSQQAKSSKYCEVVEKTPSTIPKTYVPTFRRMRAFLLLSTFTPSQGYAPFADPAAADPKMVIEVRGLNALKVKVGGAQKNLFSSTADKTVIYRSPAGSWGGRNFGGYEGFMHTLVGGGTPSSSLRYKIAYDALPTALGTPTGVSPTFTGIAASAQEYYPFQTADSDTVEVPRGLSAVDTFDFDGGPSAPVTVNITYGGLPMQTVTLIFPSATGWPVPAGDPVSVQASFPAPATGIATSDVTTWVKTTDSNLATLKNYYWDQNGTFFPTTEHPVAHQTNQTFQTNLQASWSLASRIAWSWQNSWDPQKDPSGNVVNYWGNRWRQILQPGDTIRSLVYCEDLTTTKQFKATATGDMRLAAITNNVQEFNPHPDYLSHGSRACMLRTGDGSRYFPLGAPAKVYVSGAAGTEGTFGNHVDLGGNGTNRFSESLAMANLPYSALGSNGGVKFVMRNDGNQGDFDTGVGNFADGPFSNKQDEGNVIFAYKDVYTGQWVFPTPYFSTWAYESPGSTFTSPCRQMPSPVMMGSLLTRAAPLPLTSKPGIGWETLCFCPYPPGGPSHFGLTSPPDHLLLDLFQMPVVEPYPISEPFSTAGKVNLNYPIAPFGYITRTTALRSALQALRVTAFPNTDYKLYKTGGGPPSYRNRLNRNETIKGFDAVFSRPSSFSNFYKSASQICERYLYSGTVAFDLSESAIKGWWAARTLTGDNVREKPYADLYPRVTTKSNTFTVHMRVQTLAQLPHDTTADPYGYGKWEEGKDNVLGEYRGATTIERYIDPGDARFTIGNANAVNPDTTSVESLYRFRVVGTKKFTPW